MHQRQDLVVANPGFSVGIFQDLSTLTDFNWIFQGNKTCWCRFQDCRKGKSLNCEIKFISYDIKLVLNSYIIEVLC
jgi:hypothetical protein